MKIHNLLFQRIYCKNIFSQQFYSTFQMMFIFSISFLQKCSLLICIFPQLVLSIFATLTCKGWMGAVTRHPSLLLLPTFTHFTFASSRHGYFPNLHKDKSLCHNSQISLIDSLVEQGPPAQG